MDSNMLHHPIKFSIKTNDLEKLKKKPDKLFDKIDASEPEVKESNFNSNLLKKRNPKELELKNNDSVNGRSSEISIENVKTPTKRLHQPEDEQETTKNRKIEDDQVIIEPETSSALVIKALPRSLLPTVITKDNSILKIFSKCKDVIASKLEEKIDAIDSICQSSLIDDSTSKITFSSPSKNVELIKVHESTSSKIDKITKEKCTEVVKDNKNDRHNKGSKDLKLVKDGKRDTVICENKGFKADITKKEDKETIFESDTSTMKERKRSHMAEDETMKRHKTDKISKPVKDAKISSSSYNRTENIKRNKNSSPSNDKERKKEKENRSASRPSDSHHKSPKMRSPWKYGSNEKDSKSSRHHDSRHRSRDRRHYSHSRSPKKSKASESRAHKDDHRKSTRSLEIGTLNLREDFTVETEFGAVNPEDALEQSFHCDIAKAPIKVKRNIADKLQKLLNKNKPVEEGRDLKIESSPQTSKPMDIKLKDLDDKSNNRNTEDLLLTAPKISPKRHEDLSKISETQQKSAHLLKSVSVLSQCEEDISKIGDKKSSSRFLDKILPICPIVKKDQSNKQEIEHMLSQRSKSYNLTCEKNPLIVPETEKSSESEIIHLTKPDGPLEVLETERLLESIFTDSKDQEDQSKFAEIKQSSPPKLLFKGFSLEAPKIEKLFTDNQQLLPTSKTTITKFQVTSRQGLKFPIPAAFMEQSKTKDYKLPNPIVKPKSSPSIAPIKTSINSDIEKSHIVSLPKVTPKTSHSDIEKKHTSHKKDEKSMACDKSVVDVSKVDLPKASMSILECSRKDKTDTNPLNSPPSFPPLEIQNNISFSEGVLKKYSSENAEDKHVICQESNTGIITTISSFIEEIAGCNVNPYSLPRNKKCISDDSINVVEKSIVMEPLINSCNILFRIKTRQRNDSNTVSATSPHSAEVDTLSEKGTVIQSVSATTLLSILDNCMNESYTYNTDFKENKEIVSQLYKTDHCVKSSCQSIKLPLEGSSNKRDQLNVKDDDNMIIDEMKPEMKRLKDHHQGIEQSSTFELNVLQCGEVLQNIYKSSEMISETSKPKSKKTERLSDEFKKSTQKYKDESKAAEKKKVESKHLANENLNNKDLSRNEKSKEKSNFPKEYDKTKVESKSTNKRDKPRSDSKRSKEQEKVRTEPRPPKVYDKSRDESKTRVERIKDESKSIKEQSKTKAEKEPRSDQKKKELEPKFKNENVKSKDGKSKEESKKNEDKMTTNVSEKIKGGEKSKDIVSDTAKETVKETDIKSPKDESRNLIQSPEKHKEMQSGKDSKENDSHKPIRISLSSSTDGILSDSSIDSSKSKGKSKRTTDSTKVQSTRKKNYQKSEYQSKFRSDHISLSSSDRSQSRDKSNRNRDSSKLQSSSRRSYDEKRSHRDSKSKLIARHMSDSSPDSCQSRSRGQRNKDDSRSKRRPKQSGDRHKSRKGCKSKSPDRHRSDTSSDSDNYKSKRDGSKSRRRGNSRDRVKYKGGCKSRSREKRKSDSSSDSSSSRDKERQNRNNSQSKGKRRNSRSNYKDRRGSYSSNDSVKSNNKYKRTKDVSESQQRQNSHGDRLMSAKMFKNVVRSHRSRSQRTKREGNPIEGCKSKRETVLGEKSQHKLRSLKSKEIKTQKESISVDTPNNSKPEINRDKSLQKCAVRKDKSVQNITKDGSELDKNSNQMCSIKEKGNNPYMSFESAAPIVFLQKFLKDGLDTSVPDSPDSNVLIPVNPKYCENEVISSHPFPTNNSDHLTQSVVVTSNSQSISKADDVMAHFLTNIAISPEKNIFQSNGDDNYYDSSSNMFFLNAQAHDNCVNNFIPKVLHVNHHVLSPENEKEIPVSELLKMKDESFFLKPPYPEVNDDHCTINSSASSLVNYVLDMDIISPLKSVDSIRMFKLDDCLSDKDDLSSCGELYFDDSEPQDPFNKFFGTPKPSYEHIVTTEVHVSAFGKRFELAYLKSTSCACIPPNPDEILLGKRACDESCFNRKVKVECNNNCPIYELCTNRRFQEQICSPIEPFYLGECKGWGIRARKLIPMSSFVIEYVGELIDSQELLMRIKQGVSHYQHFQMMIQKDMYLDSSNKGNWSRFVNHSCDPNTVAERWVVNGKTRIGLFSTKPISKEEEITIDYQFQQYDSSDQHCFCGSQNCRGIIGKRNEKLREQIKTSEILERVISRKSLMDLDDVSEMITVIKENSFDRDTFYRLLEVLHGSNSDLCIRKFIDCGGLDVMTSYLDSVLWDDWSLKLLYLQCLDRFKLGTRKLFNSGGTWTSVVEYWSKNPRYILRHITGDCLNVGSFDDDQDNNGDTEPSIQCSLPDSEEPVNDTESQVRLMAIAIKDYLNEEKKMLFIPKVALTECGSANDSESKSVSTASPTQDDVARGKQIKLRKKCSEAIKKLSKDEFRRLFSEIYKKSLTEKNQPTVSSESICNNSIEVSREIKQLLSNVIIEEIDSLKYNEKFSSMPIEFRNLDIDKIMEDLLSQSISSNCAEKKPSYLSSYSKSSQDTCKNDLENTVSGTDQLPPNWKFCHSDSGRIYFYHTISKKTQWEMPVYPWDAGEKDCSAYDFGHSHSYQVTTDDINSMHIKIKTDFKEEKRRERQKKKVERSFLKKLCRSDAINNKIKFSREVFKAVKIVMKPYFSSSCKVGRVTSKADLKFLCEKFADIIIGKEVKFVANLEDLELNSDVSSKISSYIKRYMSEKGRFFRRSKKQLTTVVAEKDISSVFSSGSPNVSMV